MKEADVDSEKFAMRTFLIRLGLVGKEYAGMRKILLSRLEGSGAFKSGNGRNKKIGSESK